MKTKAILNIAFLIITIFVNYLSNTGFFNGETMGSVSEQYENYFTPAGYAFSIWGLIYLALAGFVVYQAREKNYETTAEIGWWFIVSCIANCLWVVSWLYEYTGLSLIIMTVILFSLLKIVINTRMELYSPGTKKIIFVWWPFCLYAGWITVAYIANTAAYLTKIGWDGFGLSEVAWTIIVIGVAGIINLLVVWKRNMREFALVGVWGLTAVAVANWTQEQTISYAALLMAFLIFISVAIHGYRNRHSFLK